MSNSQTSPKNPLFAVMAMVVLLTAAGAVVAMHGSIASAGRGVAFSFATTAFNHHDDTATVADLKFYHPDSLDSLILKTEAQLEEGSDEAAIGSAEAAHKLDPTNSTTTLLLGASYALGGRSAALKTLIANQTDSKTIQGLLSLQTPDIAQAQELYVLGLLRSSQGVLAKVQTPSVQRSILQTEVALSLKPGKAGAVEALPFVKTAVVLDPTNLAAQKLFISVSRETGDAAAANAHQTLLNKLEAGTP